MTKKKLLFSLVTLIVLALVSVKIWNFETYELENKNVNLEITISTNCPDKYRLLYSKNSDERGENFDETKLIETNVEDVSTDVWLSFLLPANTSTVRLETGNNTTYYQIKSVKLISDDREYIYDINSSSFIGLSNNVIVNLLDKGFDVTSVGEHAFVDWSLDSVTYKSDYCKAHAEDFRWVKILCIIILWLLGFLGAKFSKYSLLVLKNVLKDRKLIINLAISDFKNKFSGSYFGVFWAFIQPIVIVTIYWFVFSVGFKSAPKNDCPYLLWLISGICPWFFFNDALNAGTSCLYEYGYIVKKMSFNLDILPVVKIVSSAFVHVFFVLLVAVVFLLNGCIPPIGVVQVVYYSVCTFVFALGLSFMTASLAVFFKDLAQIVNIVLQFGMWITPIMYSTDMFNKINPNIFKINPMYYVVEGYRDAFINNVPFWQHSGVTIYFWIITIFVFIVGVYLYKKLQPHFADVL